MLRASLRCRHLSTFKNAGMRRASVYQQQRPIEAKLPLARIAPLVAGLWVLIVDLSDEVLTIVTPVWLWRRSGRLHMHAPPVSLPAFVRALANACHLAIARCTITLHIKRLVAGMSY